MTRYQIILFFIFAISCSVYGQSFPTSTDTSSPSTQNNAQDRDSTTIVENTFFDIFTGNPGRAAFYGLIIPGGGQIYNKRWLKLPFVYGLEGYLIYSIIDNSSSYNTYQDAYLLNLNGDEPVEVGVKLSFLRVLSK